MEIDNMGYIPTEEDRQIDEVFGELTKLIYPWNKDWMDKKHTDLFELLQEKGIIKIEYHKGANPEYVYVPGPTYHAIINAGGWIEKMRTQYNEDAMISAVTQTSYNQTNILRRQNWLLVGTLAVAVISMVTSVVQCNSQLQFQEHQAILQLKEDSLSKKKYHQFDTLQTHLIHRSNDILELLKRKAATPRATDKK